MLGFGFAPALLFGGFSGLAECSFAETFGFDSFALEQTIQAGLAGLVDKRAFFADLSRFGRVEMGVVDIAKRAALLAVVQAVGKELHFEVGHGGQTQSGSSHGCTRWTNPTERRKILGQSLTDEACGRVCGCADVSRSDASAKA